MTLNWIVYSGVDFTKSAKHPPLLLTKKLFFSIKIQVKSHQIIVNLESSLGATPLHDVISLLCIQSMWMICL